MNKPFKKIFNQTQSKLKKLLSEAEQGSLDLGDDYTDQGNYSNNRQNRRVSRRSNNIDDGQGSFDFDDSGKKSTMDMSGGSGNGFENDLTSTETPVPIKKEFNFSKNVIRQGQHIDKLETIFLNMISSNHNQSASNGGFLITGDTGTGKTSFIYQLAELLGIRCITVEVPHIVEEHVINIPFVYTNTKTQQTKMGNTEVKEEMYDVKLADSNLHTVIVESARQKLTDEQLLQFIERHTDDVIATWRGLGGEIGENGVIPDLIKKVRANYNCVLFFDEFYRTTTMRIRNILRNVMNGRIGLNKIPKGCYLIYASNMSDVGGALDDKPANDEKQQIAHEDPDIEDVFHHVVSKIKHKFPHIYENDSFKTIINTLYNELEQEDISNTEVTDNGQVIRISPRRWEQIISYLAASLPAKDDRDANLLLKNMKHNFTHYKTGESHSVANKVIPLVTKLIKDISPNVSSNFESAPVKTSEWRDVLAHQIEVKMKLGEQRKYVPVISGPPGVGKSYHMASIANEFNMYYIHIDCSAINKEMATGIATRAKNSDPNKLQTKFTEPILLKIIMQQIEDQIEAQADASKLKNDDQEHKYLILFDEFNRATVDVQNVLRRVILEKNFSDEYKLPYGSVVVAAINPHDEQSSSSVSELTAHMLDAVDVIPAHTDFKSTLKFIKDKIIPDNFKEIDGQRAIDNLERKDDITNIVQTTIEMVSDHFYDSKTVEENKDRVKAEIGDDDPEDYKGLYITIDGRLIYISPRRYGAMANELTMQVAHFLTKNKKEVDYITSSEDKSEQDYDDRKNKLNIDLCKKIANTMLATYKDATYKRELSDSQIYDALFAFVYNKVKPIDLLTEHKTDVDLVYNNDDVNDDSTPIEKMINSYIDTKIFNKDHEDRKTEHLADSTMIFNYVNKKVEDDENGEKAVSIVKDIDKTVSEISTNVLVDLYLKRDINSKYVTHAIMPYYKYYDKDEDEVKSIDASKPIKNMVGEQEYRSFIVPLPSYVMTEITSSVYNHAPEDEYNHIHLAFDNYIHPVSNNEHGGVYADKVGRTYDTDAIDNLTNTHPTHPLIPSNRKQIIQSAIAEKVEQLPENQKADIGPNVNINSISSKIIPNIVKEGIEGKKTLPLVYLHNDNGTLKIVDKSEFLANKGDQSYGVNIDYYQIFDEIRTSGTFASAIEFYRYIFAIKPSEFVVSLVTPDLKYSPMFKKKPSQVKLFMYSYDEDGKMLTINNIGTNLQPLEAKDGVDN